MSSQRAGFTKPLAFRALVALALAAMALVLGACSSGEGPAVNSKGGTIKIVLPAGAAAATWTVDGGAVHTGNGTVTGLSVGSHVIHFNDTTGFDAPADKTVSVAAFATVTVTPVYKPVPTTGVHVVVTPASAAAATFTVDGGAAHPADSVVAATAGAHTVHFNALAGYTAPADQNVTVVQNQTLLVTGAYIALPGSVHVTIQPATAAAATWTLDGSAALAAGATANNVSPGTHTVHFNALVGFAAPGDQTITVAPGTPTEVVGTYTDTSPTMFVADVTAAAGANALIKVMLRNAANVAGFSATLNWDTAKLTLVTGSPAAGADIAPVVPLFNVAVAGKVSAAGAGTVAFTNTGTAAGGTLFTASLTVKTPSASGTKNTITLTAATLADVTGAPLAAPNTLAGTVTTQ